MIPIKHYPTLMKIIRLLIIHAFALCPFAQAAEAPKTQILLDFTVIEPGGEAGKSEVLSCPRVSTVAGQQATITIGTQLPWEGPAQGDVPPLQLGVEIRSTPEINKDGSITVNGSINLRSLAKEQPQAAQNIAWKAVHSLESTFLLKLAEDKPQTLNIPPGPDHPRGLQLTVTARILGQANAAVSYLKAFSLLPQLDPDETKLLKDRGADFGAVHRELLKKAHAALTSMTGADSAAHCDWQLDMSQGPELSLPYLSSSRQLSQLALLQARALVIDGNPVAAFDVWQRILKLREACAEPPLLIAELVGVTIEDGLISEILRVAPQFTPEQRAEITQQFGLLPPLDPARGVLTEKQCMLPWLTRKLEAAIKDKNGEAMDELVKLMSSMEPLQSHQEWLKQMDASWTKTMLKTLEADYDALILALSGPEQEQQAKLDDLQKILNARKEATLREMNRSIKEGKAANPELLTAMLLPSIDGYLVKLRDSQRKRLLFLAALQLLDRPDAADSDHWPLNHLPHRMKKTEKGFTLECDSIAGDKTKIIRLTVGD